MPPLLPRADTHVPQALALGALHPAAAGRRLRRLHVRPELGLRHGQERRRRHGEVVLVLVRGLVRRLRGRRVLRGRLERRRVLRLERGLLRGRGLRLVRRRQWGVQGPLPAGRKRQFVKVHPGDVPMRENPRIRNLKWH